jgi:UTP--glucose-1-phosphate uridylyltransferase
MPLLENMIETHDRLHRSVIALMEVDDPSIYGCARCEDVDENVVRITEIVEKPKREVAPSNLAVMGRYVFTPAIFDALAQVQPGVGGELQLTDGIALLMREQEVYGYTFSEGRYDTGNKLDYLRATVELAARREDLGPAFREYLGAFVRDHDL